MIRYDQMDPSCPPRGVKLEICPNCRLVGRVKRGRGCTAYIHTAWHLPGGAERRRHYCEMSDDGMRLDVVIPVMRAKEAP
jgi:hypothetical protein